MLSELFDFKRQVFLGVLSNKGPLTKLFIFVSFKKGNKPMTALDKAKIGCRRSRMTTIIKAQEVTEYHIIIFFSFFIG